MSLAASPYAAATLQVPTARADAPPGASCGVPSSPAKARSRRTLRPVQYTITMGSMATVTRSPIADPQLCRPTATLPYNAPDLPVVSPPRKAARWQKQHAHATAQAVLPVTAPRAHKTSTAEKGSLPAQAAPHSSGDAHEAIQSHIDAHIDTHTEARINGHIDDLLNEHPDDFIDACQLAHADADDVAATLHTLSPPVFLHLLTLSGISSEPALRVARLLARSGSGCDALMTHLPAAQWNPLQREALRIWLNAEEDRQQLSATAEERTACAQEATAARHALAYLQDHSQAQAADLGNHLRKAGLLVPYFNRKHGFDRPADVKLAQQMLLTYGVDLRRAHKLRTSWRARYHPRRLFGGKKSAFAAMHQRIQGLRRDLAQRERARLDHALQQAAAALFAAPQHETILRALFDSAAPEHKLEVVRQIVILRHLHTHALADQQHSVQQYRPFFAPLDLTPQQMAQQTLQEMQRLAPALARGNPGLLRALQDEARVMLMPAAQLQQQHWRPPSVQHLLDWHRQWLTALEGARLDVAHHAALREALAQLHAHLQDAAGTSADDPQMREMTPAGMQGELDEMYGRMHNHSATFHSGSHAGIAARVVLSFVPGVGLRPWLKQIAGRDAVITIGQSLSGSYVAIGRQSRREGECGADVVCGSDALFGGETTLLQGNVSVGIEAGYKRVRGAGLMIRADKLLDANGQAITWNAARQADPNGIDCNRWTMQKIDAFLLCRCTLHNGTMTVPTDARALWEDFAAAFFDSPNLQLSIYADSKTAHTVSAGVQASAKVGNRTIGMQATAGARMEWNRERQRTQEHSTRNAAMNGSHQTRRAVVAEAQLGLALPSGAPANGLHKIGAPPVHAIHMRGRFAERRHNVQYRLQQVDGKLDTSCFRYEIVSTLPELRALLERDAEVWHGMANGKARLDYFYEEYRRSYAHLPNTVFYVICDLRRPAARQIDTLNGRIARLEARRANAAADARAAWDARIAALQVRRQRILEDRVNWTPYAIDVRQTVTLGWRTGPHLGLVLQHTEGADETHVLMRMSAKPEQRHAARVRFEAALHAGG